MGGAVSAGQNNDELIDNLVEAGYIKSKQIEKIFRNVDRGDYFPGEYMEDAYKDLAWKQGNVHMSAPCIYCEVMEAMDLKEGMSFLNLGSGTGYLSTMAGLLLGPFGVNHGVELFGDVVEYSKQKLTEFIKFSNGFNLENFCMPYFVVGNCLMVNPSYRKYDRVYCGAACPLEQEKYIKSLVKKGGMLIMPIRDNLVKYVRKDDDEWEETTLLPVQFAPLIEPEEKDIGDGIVEIVSEPYSLQELCRICILRELLRPKKYAMEELPLPKSLVRFLDFYREPAENKPQKPEKTRKKQVAMTIMLR